MEVERDEAFQRRTWGAQRVGRILLVLLLLAALLGLFGPGIFNGATLGAGGEDGGPLRVAYPRTWRCHSAFTLRVLLGPEATRAGAARLRLGQDYLDAVVVESVHPQPTGMELGPDGVVYTFAVAAPGRPGTVTLELKPQRAGRLAGEIGLEGQPPCAGANSSSPDHQPATPLRFCSSPPTLWTPYCVPPQFTFFCCCSFA